MKVSPLQAPASLSPASQRRGIALVLVLACLVLLTVLVLAFMASVGTDLQTSKLYANGSSVKLLAQSATDLVMAEIHDATANGNLCWASQPGMIRTYDTSGAAINYYKLYSDGTMVGTGTFDHTQTLVPDGSGAPAWYDQKGVYVDLNQPVTINGANQYPILDGDAADLVSSGVAAGAGVPSDAKVLGPLIGSGGYESYPQVNGFWLTNKTPVDTTSVNQAPMPVKWLYVLKDGKIAVPDTATAAGSTVTFNSGIAPSSSNPIVGRMAFWTDDETSKININTASEGSYNSLTTAGAGSTIKSSFSDTPRVSTAFDLNMANAPAYQNEFQRYPGHPATVSLSTVFGNLTTDPLYPENIYSQSNDVPGLAPRTIAGGSKEATVMSAGKKNTQAALNLLGIRLYASPDELLFQPNLSGGSRALTSATLGNSAELDQKALKKAKFFITASSRAPDVTLFNTPRISMWPISSSNDTTHRTPYDRLIAFCESIGGSVTNPFLYYFQRDNYLSMTEWKDIPRNQTLLNYLRTLAGKPIPGFGGTFASKYSTSTGTGTGSEFDQILMEIFDYIRIVNLYDSSLPTGSTAGQYSPNNNSNVAGGEVLPSEDPATGTKGFGRFETVSQVGLLFIAAGDSANPQIVSYDGVTKSPGPDIAAGNTRVQAALVFSLFDPAQGYTGLYPGCTLRIKECSVSWGGYGAIFPNVVGATADASPYLTQGWSGNLGTDPIRRGEYYASGQPFFSPIPHGATATLAKNDTADARDFAGNINIVGGDITVEVLRNNTIVQTITFTVPSGNVPVPTYVQPVSTVSNSTTAPPFAYPGSFTDIPGGQYIGRWNVDSSAFTSKKFNFYMVSSGDTLQSIQPANGDIRLIAAFTTIPSGSPLFGPHPLWGKANFAHSFFENYHTHPVYGATRGQLVASTSLSQFYWQSTDYSGLPFSTPYSYSSNVQDCINVPNQTPPSTCEPLGWGSMSVNPAANGGVTAGDNKNTGWSSGNPPGDWDNGTASTPDGAYINKSDEGEFSSSLPAYFTADTNEVARRTGTAYFSPARQMPSAVMLGSLPTGVFDNRPWQTLLFHPDPTGKHVGSKGMKGDGSTSSTAPADHLLLDFFNMPVVEPYAISEPLSTAGRINMNYLMVPFTYINRDTGLRAVLSSQQMLAIPNTSVTYSRTYKQLISSTSPTFTTTTLRYPINIPETLKGFTARFNTNDIFRSASEICTLPLVPNDANATYETIDSYWQSHQLTGDNSRERPYANIYPLLTTKSNTYTIHFRVQTLKPVTVSGSDLTKWREGTDLVTGEYRGSQTIERYVDPHDSTLVDFADPSNSSATLASSYKFRIVSTKQFAP